MSYLETYTYLGLLDVSDNNSNGFEAGMDDLDKLFGRLKQAASGSKISATDSGTGTGTGDEEWGNDVVAVEDDNKDREKVFLGIERELRALPKLETGFDALGKTESKDMEYSTSCDTSRNSLNKLAKMASRKETSEEWFQLPRPDDKVKREVQRDLLLIKHRAALDPKRHYKKDKWKVPERFSVGTIVEDKTEFFSSRLKNRERKSTMLETLMADDTTNKYFKRKYTEIQDKKTSGKRAHYKKMKSMRHKR